MDRLHLALVSLFREIHRLGHQVQIFPNSSLKNRLEQHHGLQDGILLGDSGYASKPYLLTPYLRPSTREQESYNWAHKKKQIERAFGWLKRWFGVLHGENMMNNVIDFNTKMSCSKCIALWILIRKSGTHSRP